MSNPGDRQTHAEDDVDTLHSMGYSQELSRRMRAFSNFAISFSIICILAGGITSFQLGFSASGGFGAGVGWLVGGAFSLIVACSMAQIASAYPTAGGLYHWSSTLGGRGWGWATAWVNLIGLIFVIASVNVGVYLLFKSLILGKVLNIDTTDWDLPQQIIGVVIIAVSQGLFNHFGIRITTKLTDFSGYLILAVATVLTVVMLVVTPHFDFSRLFTFVNNTGDAGGGVFPQTDSSLMAFALGLLLPMYTITGFDASAHTSEETVNARHSVPKGMIHSVLWSVLFGYVMVCSFVLAMGDPTEAAKAGPDVFFNLLGDIPVPQAAKDLLFILIVVANYLCALAGVTSTSRMVFAFARDGGLPKLFRRVSPAYRTPTSAIWLTVVVSVCSTLYSPAFAALASGCVVFVYISYAMPIAAGMLAEGKTWTTFGPFRLGALSKPFAGITVLGVFLLAFIGVQPPNDIVITYAAGVAVLLLVGWFGIEKRRFAGPPTAANIKARQQELLSQEAAVGEVSR